jgi:hypothetical protein
VLATAADGRERIVGAALTPNVPAGGSAQASVSWNTLGYTGTTAVRVIGDPYSRLNESDESNNAAGSTLTIRTRPDLAVVAVAPAQLEVIAGQAVTLTATVTNTGQTDAPLQQVAFFDNGAAIGSAGVAVPAGSGPSAAVVWMPTSPGPHTLTVRADNGNVVAESNETNNDLVVPAYVGFATPLYIDAGAASDTAYTSAAGYGWSSASFTVTWGSQPYQTARLGASGVITYRFDHLLPSHFYHLDLTLYEGDRAGRTETTAIDGATVGDAVNLGDGQPHHASLLIPADTYQDHAISATVRAAGENGAVVNELRLMDIFYCYRDSGGSGDVPYTAGSCGGYLDPNASAGGGSAPESSYRADLSDNTVQYRFDGLSPSKRYQVNLILARTSANSVVERVLADGIDLGVAASLADQQIHRLTLDVPLETYRSDGSVIVTVQRTDAPSGAFVNEISLEEKTQLRQPAVRDVVVTDVADTTAVVTWLTNVASNGRVHFGPTTALGSIAQDDRPGDPLTYTHRVTLVGLTAKTAYRFYVQSADAVDDNTGSLYSFTTGAELPPPTADYVYGQVFMADGVTPATGALVRIALQDADGQGTPGQAGLLSALVDEGGYWATDLGSTRRLPGYDQPFAYSPAGDRLVITATNGLGCMASQAMDTANDAPALALSLICPVQAAHSLVNGLNLLGLTVQSDPAPLAEAVLDDITEQGGAATELYRWWNGGWDAHVRGLPFNNFTLALGKGYFVRAGAASVWTRTGRPPASPLPLPLYPGWNLVNLPRLPAALDAEAFLVGIAGQGGACSEVDRWDSATGGWKGHPKGVPINLFTLSQTEGYFVKCTKQSTYTPPATALSSLAPAPPPAADSITAQPGFAPAIYDLLVTNRRDVAFSITWRTDQPSKGWVEYGPAGVLGLVAHDDAGGISTLHHITVANLSPETVYAFRVHSGDQIADQGGQPFQVATAATTPPGVPLTAFGQVQNASGQPVVGALVRAWLADSAGARAEPLSTLTERDGYWAFSLPAEACADHQLLLQVFGPDGATAQHRGPACDVQPAPALTLQVPPRIPIYLPMIGR